MKITNIQQQRNNDDRFNIYINGEFVFSASGEDIIKLSLEEGGTITETQLQEFRDICEGTKAYNYALKLLGRMDYTKKQIEHKLSQKGYSDYTINSILAKLSEYGLINDENYAKKYIANSLNYKKYGSKKILLNLQKAGIERDDIENLAIDEDIQLCNIKELASKKLRNLGDSKNKKQKLYHYLLSKGYEYGLINIVLKEIFNDNDFEGY